MKVKKDIKKKVIVLFGGKSVEHDISIITGIQTLNALNKDKYDAVPIYISKDGFWYSNEDFFNIKTFVDTTNFNNKYKQFCLGTDSLLYVKKGNRLKKVFKIDFAFLATHGGGGENGELQGLLELCNINYSSPNTLSSSVCMNKLFTKQILSCEGIKQTKYVSVFKIEYKKGFESLKEKLKGLKLPLIVKPVSLGSSVGITFCKSLSKLKNALSFAFLFDNTVIIEEAVENLREVNLSILGCRENYELSDIEEVVVDKEILTFEGKYLNDNSSAKGMESADRIIPANIEREVEDQIKGMGKKAFEVLGCKGIVRIDFLINSKTNQVYLNEINTIPGSLSNYLWKSKKYSFSKLLDKLYEYSKKQKDIDSSRITNFSSNVLKQFKNSSKLSSFKK